MRKPVPHSNRKGFTLAELLVVIAIIGIMFAIALPTLSNITGQTKLESAANALHSAAKMARQHAVANGQPAYLVFHTPATDPTLAYRAYAVFTIDIHSLPVKQDNGQFIKDWELLPDGVIIDPDANFIKNLFDISSEGWQGALNDNNELFIDGATYVTLGFKPSGEVASASHHIHLASGTVVNGQPKVFNPCPGKQIHFTTLGKSVILDTLYGKNDGEFELLGKVE
jgi:prepilin-type N-terminal cleavage/methylation domain-containing protein